MFGFGKKSIVGVDIGTSSIKLVELTRSSGHFKLQTYGIAQLIYDKNLEKLSTTPLSVTTNTLRELMKRSATTTKRVVASLPTSAVFVTVIDIPRVELDEQRKFVGIEAKKIVPMPIEDVTVSWNAIPGNGEDNEEKQSVLLTAVPNHIIANYIKVFQELKLEPLAIEVEATALTRSLVGQDKGTVLIIDVGSRSSTVNLIDKGYIYFSKSVNVGGESITSSIAKTLNIDIERAEQFKRSLGLSGLNENNKIPRSLQPSLNLIKNEVDQVLHLSQSRGRTVEKIILTGGGAKLLGLDQHLSADFNIPVVLGNPWARVLVPEKIKSLAYDLGSSLAVCIGLAMRQDE